MGVVLVEALREFVLIAAAAGVGAVAWHWFFGRAGREAQAAARQTDSIAQARDLKAAITGIEARLEAIANGLASMERRQQEEEARSSARIGIHALLQGTRDPFLTFAEIERSQLVSAPVENGAGLSGGSLRRVLMDMVADGVIAQLDRDRYFIASDYEAGDDGEESV